MSLKTCIFLISIAIKSIKSIIIWLYNIYKLYEIKLF